MPVFLAYETKLRLLDGDRAAAKAWFEHYFVTEAQNPELYKILLHFTTVRAYIVLGELEKARALCEKLQTLAEGFHRPLDATEAAVLLAVLMWQTGERQEAAHLLEKALLDMAPYRFIRVFADEGKAVLPVLQRLMRAASRQKTKDEAFLGYLQEVCLAAYAQSRRYKGVACAAGLRPPRLSRQQQRVLELLAKGYKNAEIVTLTGLSINTIRSHTKIVYQKLEVNNAMDAVLRARELGLIG
jgi:LuxR family maltose regulon positive regulatory protein